jgi:hypothetical protein
MNIDKAIKILQSGLMTQQEQSELATVLQTAVLAEREACAKACEKVHDDYINDRNNDGYDWPDGHDCADAIRARGNT